MDTVTLYHSIQFPLSFKTPHISRLQNLPQFLPQTKTVPL